MTDKFRFILFIVCTLTSVPAAFSQDEAVESGILAWSFQRALIIDPKYRAAEATFDADMIDAKVVGSAYYPQMNISRQQAEFDNGNSRDTVSILQPILSADRFAQMREKKPRARLASLTLENARYELAMRLFQALSALTAAREGIEQNKARLDALESQLSASNRAYELGQGTRTDIADSQVKVLQAKADDIRLRSELQVSKSEFESMAGVLPPDFALKSEVASDLNDDLAETDYWLEQNIDVQIAKLSIRISELEVTRSKSSWIPEVNGSYTYTNTDGNDETFSGITFSLPVQAGKIYGTSSARARLNVVEQQGRDTQREAKLAIERLMSYVETGLIELDTRRQAIEAAELSVEANNRSYEGGVRSLLDVLTSIEVLYSVQSEYVLSALTLGENLLNLRMMQGRNVLASLSEVEELLLDTSLSSGNSLSTRSVNYRRPPGESGAVSKLSDFDFD